MKQNFVRLLSFMFYLLIHFHNYGVNKHLFSITVMLDNCRFLIIFHNFKLLIIKLPLKCVENSTLVGHQALHSSFGGKLLVPLAKTSLCSHAVLCILSCWYQEFIPLRESIATKELHTFVLQVAEVWPLLPWLNWKRLQVGYLRGTI